MVLWTFWLITPKPILPSCRKLLAFICRQKLNFIPHALMEILQRYTILFWILWACLVTITQNDSFVLLKTSMFIFMQKINFIIHFFLTILRFKESCNLIGWQHLGPWVETQNYAGYVGEISITILVFITDYFQEKLTWQNFPKNPKNLLPKFGPKMDFHGKGALSVFQYSNSLPLCQKKTEKSNPVYFLISLWDTTNFRILRLIEKYCNLVGQEHFGPYLKYQNFPKYEICSSIQKLQ